MDAHNLTLKSLLEQTQHPEAWYNRLNRVERVRFQPGDAFEISFSDNLQGYRAVLAPYVLRLYNGASSRPLRTWNQKKIQQLYWEAVIALRKDGMAKRQR